jgi:hypothetical protein
MAQASLGAESTSSGGGTPWGTRLLSAGLGIVVTVVGALVVGKLQGREPRLSYSSTESIPFNGSSGVLSIYQVTLSNIGSREVEEVSCIVRVPAAKVEQYNISANPTLETAASFSGDTLKLHMPSLNPAESVQILVLASGPRDLPTRPQVSARGKGVVAIEKASSDAKPWKDESILFGVSLASFSALLSTGLFTRLLRRRLGLGTEGDDQRQVLAYVCRLAGLSDLAGQYAAQTHKTTYWSEADRLGELALENNDPKRSDAIERALLALTEYASLAESSKAVVFYNVARINEAKPDKDSHKRYMDLAMKTSPRLIKTRMDLEARFGRK